jgi:hypothetical protein
MGGHSGNLRYGAGEDVGRGDPVPRIESSESRDVWILKRTDVPRPVSPSPIRRRQMRRCPSGYLESNE